MKLLLLFSGLALSLSLAAQYPSNSIKSRLGYQTTGDGLVYRGSGAPAYSPGTLFNAWMYLDTTNYALYMYRNFQWTKLPLVNNGLTLDGSYVQLGGTLVENTQVERSTYTLDFGKISGSNNGYLSFYGTDPHYVGILTTKDGTESGLTIGNKTWGFEIDDGSHVSSISGTRFGFDATYLGALGVSQFKMDSTNFFIRGLPSFASHTAADAGTAAYQMYTLDNSRRIYVNQGASTSDILGTGTADRLARWTGTNTLGAGSWSDNLTRLQAQVPVQFQSVTTAGLPTGVTGYTVYNTTLNGIGWYDGTRYNYIPKADRSAFTSTYVPFANASGQLTESANFTYSSSQLRVTSGTDYINFNPSNGSGRPEITLFNAGQADIRLYSDFGTTEQTLFLTGALNISGSLTLGSTFRAPGIQSGVNAGFSVQNGSLVLSPTAGNRPFINFTEQAVAFKANLGMTAGSPGDLFYETSPTSTNAPQTGTQRFRVNSNGRFGIGAGSTINYSLEQLSQTDAFGVARGTVVQRPTIVASTTPFRYNTDSTALEYGESVGVWRGIATRPYARSLVAGLPTTNIYTANGTLTSNRILTGGSYNLTFNAKTKIGSDSSFVHDPAQDTTYAKGTVRIKSGALILQNDTGGAYMTIQAQGAGNKEAGILMESKGVFGSVIYINGETLSTFGIYNFDKVGGGGVNMTVGESPGFTGMSSIGDFIITDSTSNSANTSVRFKFDSRGDARFYDYGTGTKEAADLGKTQSAYITGFATDGTVLEVERKRDTTIFLTADTDYDFSAAVTTAQIASRYNRIIIHMTLTSGVGADKTTTLHTPDANLMQCEILIRGTDNTGTYDNEIAFGTNNAISSDGTNTSGYTLAQGQGLHVRVVYNGSAYKYIYY